VSEKNKVPAVEGLFTWPSAKPKLIASRCKVCGTPSFPKAPYCTNPDCEKKTENVEIIELSNRAKLFTFAVQAYAPPEPFKLEPFEPFPLGMLDFPEGLRILGMLTTDKVKIGQEMEMTVKKMYEDDKNEYLTWAWKPVGK
jgi:uncharacterized protein